MEFEGCKTAPAVSEWGRTLDGFITAKLQAVNLLPQPEADRHTLIRRLTRPHRPAADGADGAVCGDTKPGAYERLVDFLAKPAFGERWGRHWLELCVLVKQWS